MALCPRCGVELGDRAKTCPLCGKSIEETLAASTRELADSGGKKQLRETEPALPKPAPHAFPSDAERAGIWEFASVLALIVGIVLALTAWVTDGFGWLFYPLAGVLFLWFLATALLLPPKLRWLALAMLALAPFGLLAAIDGADGVMGWFWQIGLPITLAAELATGIVAIAFCLTKRKGFNIVAFILMGIALILLAIEGAIDFWARGVIHFDWANIACIALLPVAAFFVYVHYRVGKKTTLKKIFHL